MSSYQTQWRGLTSAAELYGDLTTELRSALAPWRTYTDPVILEFLLGMLIAATAQRASLFSDADPLLRVRPFS